MNNANFDQLGFTLEYLKEQYGPLTEEDREEDMDYIDTEPPRQYNNIIDEQLAENAKLTTLAPPSNNEDCMGTDDIEKGLTGICLLSPQSINEWYNPMYTCTPNADPSGSESEHNSYSELEDEEEGDYQSSSSASPEYLPNHRVVSTPQRACRTVTKRQSNTRAKTTGKAKKMKAQSDDEKKRKAANCKNSKNYNERIKKKKEQLEENCEQKNNELSWWKNENGKNEQMLVSGINWIGRLTNIHYEHHPYWNEKLQIENNAKNEKMINQDYNKTCIARDARQLKYKEACEDTDQKERSIQTFGSRKSRSLQQYKIADFEVKMMEHEMDIKEQKEIHTLLTRCITAISDDHFKLPISSLSPDQYLSLTANERSDYEHVGNFFKQYH